MGEPTTAQKKQWMRQWTAASAMLEKVKWAELRALSDEDVRHSVSVLLDDVKSKYKHPRYETYSGLIEQQRYFKRFRKIHKTVK